MHLRVSQIRRSKITPSCIRDCLTKRRLGSCPASLDSGANIATSLPQEQKRSRHLQSKTHSPSSLCRTLTLNAPQSSSVAGLSGITTRRQKQRPEVYFRSAVSQVFLGPSAFGFLRGPVARSSLIILTRIAHHHLKSFITTDPTPEISHSRLATQICDAS